MRKVQRPLAVSSLEELESLVGADVARAERLELAKRFKFATQRCNPRVTRILPLGSVKYAGFHDKHKKAFAKLHFILSKYRVDVSDYLDFVADVARVYTPELALDKNVFRRYSVHRATEAKYKYIYESYSASVKKLAEACVERGISAKEYLAEAVKENRLAYDLVAGRMSKYFLVSIQNFSEVYKRLDQLNKDELSIIYGAKDELKVMVNEAVVKATGRYPKPIGDTEAEITKIKNQLNNKNN